MGVLDQFSLAGKTALVTGGAGIVGRPIVRALAEAGAATYVAARNLAALEELAAEHRQDGYQVTVLQYDQAAQQSVLQLHDTILTRSGRLDILVNNAVARPMQLGFRDDAAKFAESMSVNATGLFIITRAFGDTMARQAAGSIINIGSIQGIVAPDPTIYQNTDMSGWYPDYFFHKGGMVNFTRFVASYYGGHGVRCNCLSPGGVQTDRHPEAFVSQYSARTLLGRMANQSDLMGAIVFLASDAARYITGVNLPVDGGYTAK